MGTDPKGKENVQALRDVHVALLMYFPCLGHVHAYINTNVTSPLLRRKTASMSKAVRVY